MKERLSTKIKLVGFTSGSEAIIKILNGPYVDSTNEKVFDRVRVRTKKMKVRGGTFRYSYEPHSFTAIEIK